MPRISACFEKMSEAKKAVEALKLMGYKNSYLDMHDSFMEEYSADINAAGTEAGPSLSALVQNSGSRLRYPAKAPLTAADPAVSGLGCYEDAFSVGTRLVVGVETGNAEAAERVIREYGGRM
jgi:hypothetical protein